MYNYSAYGLNIYSEIPLPELLPGTEAPPDITICCRDVPGILLGKTTKFGIWEARKGELLLKIDHIAHYLILDGREIRVEAAVGSTAEDIRVFLLGSAMAALLHQRRLLVLHASSIQTERGAVLFMGRSGSGKSTLSAALVQRGYPLLADDVSAVTLNVTTQPSAKPLDRING